MFAKMRGGMRSLVLLGLFAAVSLPAQYVRPGPQMEGCPLRAVEATIQTISPQGQLTLDSKGELIVAQITSETRYQIPGYDKKEIQEAPTVKFPPGTRAKFRICQSNGEVMDMKVLEDKKNKKKKD
jgi:hypothetical protein